MSKKGSFNKKNYTTLDGEKFDIVYSNDLFASACVSYDEAKHVATLLPEATAEGGLGFHLVAYRKINPIMHELGTWLKVFETGGNLKAFEREQDELSNEEIEDSSWTNVATLDPQYLLRHGFRIKEYTLENNYLTIVSEK